jgi:hypothetical protein
MQPRPTIFIFDRDNDQILPKIDDIDRGYRSWGNNVYSFALPVPSHRSTTPKLCIEGYYSDDELRTPDSSGRRLYLSSEFDKTSGRHRSQPHLSVGNKDRLSANAAVLRVIDSGVYDELGHNIALSKADFANSVSDVNGTLDSISADAFRLALTAIELVVEDARDTVDLLFGDLHDFRETLKLEEPLHALATTIDGSVRLCKLVLTIFSGATIRYYEHRVIEPSKADAKRVKPITQLLASFTNPTLTTLHKLARHCYHLVDSDAPIALQDMKAALAATPVLGIVGDLLDRLEALLGSHGSRKVRVVNKSQLRKPILDFVITEFAQYEGRASELRELSDGITNAPSDIGLSGSALDTLINWFATWRALTYRSRLIERVVTDSDQFSVRLTTFASGRERVETVTEQRTDIADDRLQTTELLLPTDNGDLPLDLYPFVTIDEKRLCYYNRTRKAGYEYTAAFVAKGPLIATRRKFNHSALRATLGMQGLFWTQVSPTTSGAGVRANIPFEGRIIGRKQQLAKIMDEIVRIPNQNGIIFGPGGVGKTALLVELSRQLFEDPGVDDIRFDNIIWVSAKRDYYEPSFDDIEQREPQFSSLDNVLTAILEFHEWEDASNYDLPSKKWLVLETLQDQSTLLILDNFESVEPRSAQDEIVRFFGLDAKRVLRNSPERLKVLVTSREVIPSGFHQIELKGLDRRESKRLMASLYDAYASSGRGGPPSDDQLDQLYDATHGIPLLIKHCYAQIYEFGSSFDFIIGNLLNARSKVMDFSFAEIFKLLKNDDILLRSILVLEVSGRPLMRRQMADILSIEEEKLAVALNRLMNFQCVNRMTVGFDEKYVANAEARLLAKRLAQEYAEVATDIKRRLAGLTLEKRLDYTKAEFDAVVVLQEYIAQGHYVLAEDHIREELRRRPNSILLNLQYAQYLNDVKRRTGDAIEVLERIRVPSGNDQQVLRLLMAYYSTGSMPNFEQANTYAHELEELAQGSTELKMEIARFYVHWSTAIKIRFEIDPIQEMLRQQRYKELAEKAIGLLEPLGFNTPEWNQLLAQSYYNVWNYDAALGYAEEAISALPPGSHLAAPYQRLKGEILRRFRTGGAQDHRGADAY